MKPWLIGGLLLLVWLSACSNAPSITESSETVSPVASGTLVPQSAYPSPSGSASAYPAPGNSGSLTAAPATLVDVPAPSSANVGTVTGVLILAGDPERPVSEAILYLGEIITLADGQPALAALDKQAAPVTQSNGTGQFIFEDVPLGEYTLILDLIASTFVLNQPQGGDFIIQVGGGEITDLGVLRYSDLPIP